MGQVQVTVGASSEEPRDTCHQNEVQGIGVDERRFSTKLSHWDLETQRGNRDHKIPRRDTEIVL